MEEHTMPASTIVVSVLAVAVAAAPAFDHSAFDRLLRRHVTEGLVDYDAFGRSPEFRAYLEALASAHLEDLPEPERLAFWINAYNAWTIEQVNAHEERESIRNINRTLGLLPLKGPWSEKMVRAAGRTLSLDDVEHGIIPYPHPFSVVACFLKIEDKHLGLPCWGPGYGCLFILNLAKGDNVYIARGIDELHTLTAQFVGHPGIDIIGHQQPFVGHLLDLIDQGAKVRVLCPFFYLDCECFATRQRAPRLHRSRGRSSAGQPGWHAEEFLIQRLFF